MPYVIAAPLPVHAPTVIDGALIPIPTAPIAREVLSFPIDPYAPLELEDGTPVELITVGHYTRTELVQIRLLGSPSGLYASYTAGETWWHNLTDGSWDGDSRYLKLRNVVEELEPLPVPEPVVTYEVRAGLNGTDRDQWGTVQTLESGKAAADWVKFNRELFSSMGKSLVIVKVERAGEPEDWRARELSRLASGEYVSLPNDWTSRLAAFFPEHFAHVASSDKRKVAFTESEASGLRDRQKVLSASVYAERYMAGVFAQSHCDEFIADMLGDSLKPLFAPLGDADAMEALYRETSGGPCHGCMSGPVQQYASPIHPVRVYAMGGEITLAFLRGDDSGGIDYDAGWQDDDSPIVARCLVWDDSARSGRKEFGRLYGDCNNARALRTALEAQGYKSGSLSGARIAAVEHHGDYVMPYLDIGGREVSLHYDSDKDEEFFKVGGGELCAQSTSGLMSVAERFECQCCGDSFPEDEAHSVYTGPHSAEDWCESCASNEAFFCEVAGERVADSRAAEYLPSGSRYTEYVADWELEDTGAAYCSDTNDYRCDYFVCEDCGETFSEDNLNENEGESVCDSCNTERLEKAEADSADDGDTCASIAA